MYQENLSLTPLEPEMATTPAASPMDTDGSV
jgi:hypothetical protein